MIHQEMLEDLLKLGGPRIATQYTRKDLLVFIQERCVKGGDSRRMVLELLERLTYENCMIKSKMT